jgi:hypothetical protein
VGPVSRSTKALASSAAFTGYQRAWFGEVRARVAAGEPLAVVNADTPHEIFRALDIPYVVNQWWSSIISAKQLAPRYLEMLAGAGYPDDDEQYNALALGEVLAADPGTAPWGGLPTPTILCATATSDAMRKLFEIWAERTGAHLHLLERTIDSRPDLDPRWWEQLPGHWDSALETERLDLMVAELRALVGDLAELTGRRLDEDRLAEVLDLVNEQEAWYRRTRALVAATVPAPVSVADTIVATMIPQWHRGTEWGRDAARAVHDEVAERVRSGTAACPGERLRLMWLGRGLWSSMGLYQALEERYGAVFVWSMYLALAADGYLRETKGDPLRALAARVLPMGDELRLPTWSSAWHVHEARTHGIDAVVSLGEDDWFSRRALEAEGIPVLHLDGDNTDRRDLTDERLYDEISRFIEERVESRGTTP